MGETSLSLWVGGVADLPRGVLGGQCVEVSEISEVDSQVRDARQTSSVHVLTELLPKERWTTNWIPFTVHKLPLLTNQDISLIRTLH